MSLFRLNATVPSKLYYLRPHGKAGITTQFEEFLVAFGLRENPHLYYLEKSDVCYKDAVFGCYLR